MLANIITAGFISVASFLIFLRQNTRTGRSSYLVMMIGFAFLAVDLARAAKTVPPMPGLSLLSAGFVWILLDTYGCLEWTKRR